MGFTGHCQAYLSFRATLTKDRANVSEISASCCLSRAFLLISVGFLPLIRPNSRCLFCSVLWLPFTFHIQYVNSIHTLLRCLASNHVLLRHHASSQQWTVIETGYPSLKRSRQKTTTEITSGENILVVPLVEKSTGKRIFHSFSAKSLSFRHFFSF